MASYSVRFKPSVEKDLRNLPKGTVSRVMLRIDSLAENPFPPGFAKLVSTGRMYRVRAGDYRIVYEVDSSAGIVTVHYVRHRPEVYRGM
ncbi:MAG: type II toxin-antitoxin system RelE/ParE family toxin [Terriglobia bacterium]|jgi:mRNA interferase RelE/StbE